LTTIIANASLSATINSKGAELISLKNSTINREYIWEGNPEFWGKHSPVLFPIVGTLKNDQYQYNNEFYSLSRHGFARDLNFKIIEKEANKVVFSLVASDETKEKYPFDFELQISYVLDEQTLTIEYKISNNSKETMPFSIGAHPAFALPELFESYALAFEYQEALQSYSLEKDLLSDKSFVVEMSEKVVPLAYSLFENDALIFKKMQSKQITILENAIPILDFKFTDFPNFGIWTKANAPFLCLEPWLGYSDSLTASGKILEKEAIQFLSPKTSFDCQFSIAIL
jgi:galactose mutarotase-like enzyme